MGLTILTLLCLAGMAWIVLHATGRNREPGDELIHPEWDKRP
jgi:hypothetical protein